MGDGIKVRSTGVEGKQKHLLEQEFHNSKLHGSGAIAYTQPIEVRIPFNANAVNDLHGVEMAQNGAFSGTPVNVHNGLDDVYWTGSSPVGGKVTFDSDLQSNDGDQSVLFNNLSIADTVQFLKASPEDLSDNVAISLAIYVGSNWQGTDLFEIYGWDSGAVSEVGIRVSLGDYFNFINFGQWHTVTIPLSDMELGSSTIDSFRIQCSAKAGQGPIWYLDSFQIEEAGTPIIFDLTGPPGQTLYLETLELIFTDVHDGTLLNSSMPNLSYDKILAEAALTNGLLIVLFLGGEATAGFNIRTLGDAFQTGYDIVEVISDSTNSVLKLRQTFGHAVPMSSSDGSRVSISVRDNLTSFISVTVRGQGYILPEQFQHD